MDGGSGMFYFIQSVLQEYFIGGGTDESESGTATATADGVGKRGC